MSSKTLVLPTWIKIAAALAAVALILAGVGGVMTISWARTAMLNAIDQPHIAATLKRIGEFPDHLLFDDKNEPNGQYHAVLGGPLPLLDADGVAFDEKAAQLQFIISRYKSVSSDPDALEEIDHFYEFPALLPTMTGGKFVSIVDKAKVPIAGRQFNYETVLLKDDRGASYKGMIGCLVAGRKVVVVEAASPAERPFDSKFVLDFLGKARAF